MKIVETIEHDVTDDELKEAIELRHSDCFTALALVRDIRGGTLETHWKLVATFSPVELIKEAQKRELNIEKWRPAIHCDNLLLVETKLYLSAIKIIEQENNDGK